MGAGMTYTSPKDIAWWGVIIVTAIESKMNPRHTVKLMNPAFYTTMVISAFVLKLSDWHLKLGILFTGWPSFLIYLIAAVEIFQVNVKRRALKPILLNSNEESVE